MAIFRQILLAYVTISFFINIFHTFTTIILFGRTLWSRKKPQQHTTCCERAKREGLVTQGLGDLDGSAEATVGAVSATTSSLGVTSMDRNVSSRGDESNQETLTQASSQRTVNFQTQINNGTSNSTMPGGSVDRAYEMDGNHYSTPMFVSQYTFPSSATLGQVLARIDSNAILSNKNIARLFIDKRFAKFDIRFTFNVTGNPQATGLFALGVTPTGPIIPGGFKAQTGTATTTNWTNPYDRILAVNHLVCDASLESEYVIDMPWAALQTYYSAADYLSESSYSSLYAVVLSPFLPQTGGPTAINFEVYATIMNIETVERAPYVSQSLFSFGESTTVNNRFDKIENSNVAANTTGDHITASVPESFGLDNPSDGRNAQESVFRMAYQKVASWMNVLDVWKTSNTPKVVADFTPAMSKEMRLGVDEMAIDFFRGRWYTPGASNGVVPITTSMATGTRLFSYPITPIPVDFTFAGNFSSNNNCDWAMWLSSFFRWWRGSIKFRILIASNQFKRGKLLVCVNYGYDINSLPATMASGAIDPRSLPHCIIDLSNKDRVIDIEIPYKSVFEYMRVPNMVSGLSSMPYKEMCLGQIAAYVQSPLTVANGTASTINLNVLQCLGPDFEFYTQVQGSAVGRVTQSRLPITPGVTTLSRSHMMTAFRNIRELLFRPVSIGTYDIGVNGGAGFGVSPLVIPISPKFLTFDALWSGVLSMYSGMRGGMRIHLKTANINTKQSMRVQYYENLVPLNGSSALLNPLGLAGPYTGGNENFDYSALSTSVNGSQIGYNTPIQGNTLLNNNIPQLMRPGINTPLGSLTLNPAAAGANSINTFGLPAIAEIIVDPYSQPEVIIEIPDPAPNYSTLECANSSGTWGTGANQYCPLYDRTIGFLVITPMDVNYNDLPSPPAIYPTTVEVMVSAADDFRAFWYNGGPTGIVPQCTGYQIGTSTSYTYTHLLGK